MEFRKDYIVWHVARNVVMMIHYLIEGMEDKLVICVVYERGHCLFQSLYEKIETNQCNRIPV